MNQDPIPPGGSAWRRLARLVAVVVTLAALTSVVLLPAVVPVGLLATNAIQQLGVPPVGRALERPPERSLVYAADGTVLARLHATEDRVVIPLSGIPPDVRDAVLAIEDARFYRHGALDYRVLGRALLADLYGGGIRQGGSTITQQSVKQTVTGASVTLRRRLAEAIGAIQLERRLSKDRILEAYLNEVYFGEGAYGIEAAAEHYFSEPARELTLAEGAALAAAIASPARFRPTAGREALARRNLVLGRMAALGFAPGSEVAAALRQPLRTHLHRSTRRYPFFVQVVERQLLRDHALDGTLGPAGSAARERALFEGGLAIHTTLGTGRQRLAEAAVAEDLGAGGPQAA